MRPIPTAVIFTAILVHASATAAGPLPPILHGRPRAWQPPAATARAGMLASIDPITREWVPARSADLPAVTPSRREVMPEFVMRAHPDGSRFVLLGGRLRAYTVVRIEADGNLAGDCLHSEREAREWLNPTVPPDDGMER